MKAGDTFLTLQTGMGAHIMCVLFVISVHEETGTEYAEPYEVMARFNAGDWDSAEAYMRLQAEALDVPVHWARPRWRRS